MFEHPTTDGAPNARSRDFRKQIGDLEVPRVLRL
jgi:hypothetical protein